VDVPVDSGEDVDRVVSVLERAGDELRSDDAMGARLVDRPTVLGVEALGDGDVTLRVVLKTQPAQQATIGRRYRTLVKKAFDREGIALPSSQQVVLAPAESTGSCRCSTQSREACA
jgi:small conductance mechanosensitive channel